MTEIFEQSSPARRLAAPILALLVAMTVGCGSNYRPTTFPITGTGPASQIYESAFVVSRPSPTGAGEATVVNYSGDIIMATSPIGPGPITFAMNASGTEAWSLNADGTLSNVPVSSQLQEKNVFTTTLSSFTGVDPIVGIFGGAVGEFTFNVATNEIGVLNGVQAASLKYLVPVDSTPVTMVGNGLVQRYYAITQTVPYLSSVTVDGQTVDGGVACNYDAHSPNLASQPGFADGIETSTYTVSSHIPVGVCPVYAIGSTDTKRVFVLNRGSDNITVINSQNNTLDSCTPFLNQNGQPVTCHPSLPLTPAPGLTHAGPVYAEYNPATSQIVVANYEGNSISIIDVSLDEYGNDSPTFGTTFTVPVGNHPASVTVLGDGSRAYVANQSDQTVSIVNMSSHTLIGTLPVYGHPRTVVSTQNSLYGKVYVASPDSPYLTLIRTDQDIVDTTVLVQGNALDVRISSPDGSAQNSNIVSRLPGAGQPCYLAPEEFTAAAARLSINNCRAQDPTAFLP